MIRFEIKKRDGLARAGTMAGDELPCSPLPFPAVLDTVAVFPALSSRGGTNVPLSAPPAFAAEHVPKGAGQPVIIHPALENPAMSGDVVMVAGWHTALANPRQYVTWLKALRDRTPPDTLWYAPAAAFPSTVHILCYTGFTLFDYTGVDLKSAQGLFCTSEGEFPADVQSAGLCGCEGCRNGDLTLHNRLALEHEVAIARYFTGQQKLRELVEARCRMNANSVAIMRHLDQDYAWSEPFSPVARSGVMRANSGESMQRVEVRRFAERLLSRYKPPKATVAVLLPCSAKKPYSLSQSHRRFQMAIAGRAHELIVTSPLGLVPRELECVYPAMHYDVPVTGYWDAEECAYIADTLAKYLAKNKYDRVIAHLEGGALKVAEMAAEHCGITLEYSCRDHPAGEEALNRLSQALACERRVKDDRVHGMLSYQFGCDIDTRGMLSRGHFPEIFYSKNNQQFFSIDTGTGLLRPTFEGWGLVNQGYRVTISDFIPEGDVLVPGVVDADPAIREGDEVLVVGSQAMATGKAAMTAAEMKGSRRGVAVRVRKVKKL
ncbi:archaeosine synthase subunit alpha [Methanoregula sp.]|uniref:archaeosine synthase subunit alpha n=1 Tax=Methanoregula sp. TaxID=2052170 RepID=UPI002B7E875B|nr:archaeosine synthase subunit alpha [Methanoregula sp.]HVP96136.1 archaeosine synthase subunit alpha [Methanoregula sp.]